MLLGSLFNTNDLLVIAKLKGSKTLTIESKRQKPHARGYTKHLVNQAIGRVYPTGKAEVTQCRE